MKLWKSKLLETSLWAIKIGKEFWFFGKEVAKALGYTKPKNAIISHVDLKDKKGIKDALGSRYKIILERSLSTDLKLEGMDFIQKLHPDYTIIKEIGFYSICTNSRKEKAFSFHRWIFETIQEIRETGSYTLPCGPVENPLSLMDKISNLEEKVKTLERGVKTCDKETQTTKSVVVVDGSFRELEKRIDKSLKKTKSSLKKTIKEAKLDLKKSILDLENPTRRTSSSSSSSQSEHQLFYSSDSD